MKTFKDLEFKKRPVCGFQAVMNFNNGYGVSVLLGNMFYSNGKDTYELAVLEDGYLCYTTPITENVLGYLTEDEVTEVMRKIQELPSNYKVEDYE